MKLDDFIERPKIRITQAYEVYDPDEFGNMENEWEDDEGKIFDTVEEAANYLINEGILEVSSSECSPDVWYNTEEYIPSYQDNLYRVDSYFIKDANDEQKMELCCELFPHQGGCEERLKKKGWLVYK